MLNKPHFCQDWDFLYVVPGCPEMESCLCASDGEGIKRGDILKTSFVTIESEKERVVESCYKSVVKSQTGWWVKVKGLGQLDAGWFRER